MTALRVLSIRLLLAGVAVSSTTAQVRLADREIEFHGFFSQGFLKSDSNNYLTMPSRRGSFRLTDGGLNASTQFTNRFRVGAQAYVRRIGELGQGHVTLDWAFGDYRVNDWFGVRVGRVKTPFGLYNDTQDLEFLHTWALLPQSIYPMDLRGYNLSHTGGDLYGHIPLRRAGSVSYTLYGGAAPADRAGGLQYGLSASGFRTGIRRGSMYGTDVKWTPVPGLLLGTSYQRSKLRLAGENTVSGGPFRSDSWVPMWGVSAQYSRNAWRVEWEYARAQFDTLVHTALSPFGPYQIGFRHDVRGGYAAGTYRINKWLEVGTYHSRFFPNADRQVVEYQRYQPSAERHIFDQALTARFDFLQHWDLKIEGHMMDGYGDLGTARGFYAQDNPAGLVRRTNLWVIRLGFNR